MNNLFSNALSNLKSDFGPNGRFKKTSWLRRWLFGQHWLYRWSLDQKWQPADVSIEKIITGQLKMIAVLLSLCSEE